jgi:hypothetical protein
MTNMEFGPIHLLKLSVTGFYTLKWILGTPTQYRLGINPDIMDEVSWA